MSMSLHKNLLTKHHLARVHMCFARRCSSDKTVNTNNDNVPAKSKVPTPRKPRSTKVFIHLARDPNISELKPYIPKKYFAPKQRLTPRHLYLVDKKIAKTAAEYIMPFLNANEDQLVCETNAGFGLIAKELLESGIPLVRLYETCPEFRELLKSFNRLYPNRVELFVKDIYHISSLNYMDKHDGGDRAEQVFRRVPTRSWTEDPVMTIIGPMPNLDFLKYLLQMVTLQQGIATHGRVQLFAFMRPLDYNKCCATVDMNLHMYQALSILFQLFFDCELLEKFPRTSFLPWETAPKDSPKMHPYVKVDLDYMYLVRINFKKILPTEPHNLLYLHYFIKQGFLRGKRKVIPILEKWLPGIGVNLITPTEQRKPLSYPNMNIYTEFGELSPTQILQIFIEMVEHPEFIHSPFVAVVESQMLKTETIETDLALVKSSQLTENMQDITF